MGKPEYILLIDDDEMANFLNKSMLDLENAAEETFVVENGHQALSIVDEITKKGDSTKKELCILLDLDMPTLDGYEFLEALKKERPDLNIQVYILSILSESKEKAKFTKYPIEKFIGKPLKERDVNYILTNNKPVYFNQVWEADVQ